jgi:membrane dipeptidase
MLIDHFKLGLLVATSSLVVGGQAHAADPAGRIGARRQPAANVTAELMRRGYGEADIGKLWGGNHPRVFKAVEAKARR